MIRMTTAGSMPPDERFADFRLWRDANLDGVSQSAELVSLTEAGIASLSLAATAPSQASADDATISILGTTSFTRTDGTSGLAGDIALRWQHGTPPVPAPAASVATAAAEATDPPLPALANARFDRSSGKYRFESRGGSLFVSLRRAGMVDPRVGEVGAAGIFSFSNRRVGMLAPIILDLEGEGIRLKSRGDSKARFDMDGNGVADRTGWIGKGQGILVMDRNGDGRISNGAELSFFLEKPDAKSGLEALAALDADRNGVVELGRRTVRRAQGLGRPEPERGQRNG